MIKSGSTLFAAHPAVFLDSLTASKMDLLKLKDKNRMVKMIR